jgi:hypothetical protein
LCSVRTLTIAPSLAARAAAPPFQIDLKHLGHSLFWEEPQGAAAMIDRFLDGRF